MSRISKTKIGYFQAVSGGILWGFSGSCGQFLFRNCSVTPQWLLPIRMVSTGIILLLISSVKNKGNIFSVWKDRNHLPRMIAFIIFGLIACQYTYYSAIAASNAGIATVLQYLSPAIIVVYLCLKNKRLPVPAQIAALILAIGGTFVIATGGNIHSFSITPYALIMGILSAVFLVCYSIIPQPILKDNDTSTVLGWGMLLGGIVLTPVFRPWIDCPDLTPSLMLAVIGIVIFGTVLAYTLYLDSIKRIGADKASFLSSIEPASATIISALWLKTTFSIADVIGIIMILITIIIITFTGKE